MLPCCRRPQDARSSSSCRCIFRGKLRVGFPGKASTQLLPMVFHLTLHLLYLSGEGSYLQLVSMLSVWHVLSPSALKAARITEEREKEKERDTESDLSLLMACLSLASHRRPNKLSALIARLIDNSVWPRCQAASCQG